MPGATPVYGIRYPTATDAPMDPDVFGDMAADVEGVLAGLDDKVAERLALPVLVAGTNSSAVTVPGNNLTTVVFTTPTIDSSGMWSSGTPNQFTVTEAGLWWIKAYMSLAGGGVAEASYTVFVYVNGAGVFGDSKDESTLVSGVSPTITAFAAPLNVGDVVTVRVRWSLGAGGPATLIFGNVNMTRLCPA